MYFFSQLEIGLARNILVFWMILKKKICENFGKDMERGNLEYISLNSKIFVEGDKNILYNVKWWGRKIIIFIEN